MEQVDFFSAWQVTFKSNGPDKKERTKRNEHVGMYNALMVLILLLPLINSVTGLHIKFYGIFAKQHVCSSLLF